MGQAPRTAVPYSQSHHTPGSKPSQPDETGTAVYIPVTNTLERLNKEVKRRADVVGIFPSEQSIIRLVGAVLLEANDEWQLQHRYLGVEAMAETLNPAPTNETLQLPPQAA